MPTAQLRAKQIARAQGGPAFDEADRQPCPACGQIETIELLLDHQARLETQAATKRGEHTRDTARRLDLHPAVSDGLSSDQFAIVTETCVECGITFDPFSKIRAIYIREAIRRLKYDIAHPLEVLAMAADDENFDKEPSRSG
jgi:hypothetical protein